MRRTVRALSLATATGATLAALTPAVFAGAVPDDGTFRGAASHAPCPEPEEHEWEPDALDPAGPEAVVPRSTALEGPDAEPDAEDFEDPGGPEDPEGFEAYIPAPEEPEEPEGSEGSGESGAPGDLKGFEDSGGGDPVGPGAVEPKTLKPEPTAYRPSTPESGGSGATPCASAPVYRGVHAGGGGAFTDSVPALAVGGLLIAGAFAAAAHRVHRDRTTRTDG
ncbi:hypothetical protein KYY02_08720 [Streptomyces pimonensis]|uniref:Secreted protein n=1 Tax=Streptomyces pimonensis TaxID=2860288 RepID=A0ABV4IW21_9ACTN